MASQNENLKNTIHKHHVKLGLALSRDITTRTFQKLKRYFLNGHLEEEDLKDVDHFLDLWSELEIAAIIREREYEQLEEAFRCINARMHIDAIKEYTEKMNNEVQVNVKWVTHDELIESKEDLLDLIEKFRPLMLTSGRYVGTVQVYNNAVFGLITVEGGELRIKNGSAKLYIPANALRSEEVLYLYQPAAKLKENNALQLANMRIEDDNDNVVKCSLPVWLGPEGFNFESNIQLKLRAHNEWPAESLSVYRKANDNGTWEEAGSCILERRTQTATIHLRCFSSYVLGTTESLNVHIMVERLPQKEEAGRKTNDIRVILCMNDYSYIEELVMRKEMNIQSETCQYLDPKHDIVLTRKRGNSDGEVTFERQNILKGDMLCHLSEMCEAIPLECDQDGREKWDILILEQNGERILELPCNKETDMETARDQLGKARYNETGELPTGSATQKLHTNLTLAIYSLALGLPTLKKYEIALHMKKLEYVCGAVCNLLTKKLNVSDFFSLYVEATRQFPIGNISNEDPTVLHVMEWLSKILKLSRQDEKKESGRPLCSLAIREASVRILARKENDDVDLGSIAVSLCTDYLLPIKQLLLQLKEEEELQMERWNEIEKFSCLEKDAKELAEIVYSSTAESTVRYGALMYVLKGEQWMAIEVAVRRLSESLHKCILNERRKKRGKRRLDFLEKLKLSFSEPESQQREDDPMRNLLLTKDTYSEPRNNDTDSSYGSAYGPVLEIEDECDDG